MGTVRAIGDPDQAFVKGRRPPVAFASYGYPGGVMG